jgi:hypothetical protein
MASRTALRWAAAYFGLLCALALARNFYMAAHDLDDPRQLAFTVAHALLEPTFWAVLLLLTFRVSQRAWAAGAPGVLVVAGVTLAFQVAVQAALLGLRQVGGYSRPTTPRAVLTDTLLTYPTSVVITLSLLAAGSTVGRMARVAEAEARASRLAADVTALRASALENQLRPHFFFNTLQSIATLLHRDPEGARAMLYRLRRLLESSLAADPRPAIPLAEELALLALYTDIETVRFRDRLRVETSTDPDAGRALVPRFLLQPLVENAITHAVAVRGEGVVTVAARIVREAGRLELRVRDTGAGEEGSAVRRSSSGIGLANTRGRLAALYGSRFTLDVVRGEGPGTTVRLAIPFEEARPQASSSSSAQRA